MRDLGISNILPKEVEQMIFRNHGENALGLIGCRTSSFGYPICEYDVLIVKEVEEPTTRIVIEDHFVDLVITSIKSMENLQNNKLTLSLDKMKILKDPNWILTSAKEAVRSKEVEKFRNIFVHNKISQVLAKLGRSEDALQQEKNKTSSFWILSSGYDCVEAIIGLMNEYPSTSHILTQIKNHLKSLEITFDLGILGLNQASVNTVARRMEALELVISPLSQIPDEVYHDKVADMPIIKTDEFLNLTRIRQRYLLKSHRILDAYAYLGVEVIKALEYLFLVKCKTQGTSISHVDILEETIRSGPSTLRVKGDIGKMLDLQNDEKIIYSKMKTLKSTVKDLISLVSEKKS